MFFTSSFIDIDTFYSFLNWFSTRVSDDRRYVCGLDSREITSLPDIEKVIYMACLFSHRRKQIARSSHDSFAYSESLQHPTITILLIQILIFLRPLSSVHLLQGNQRFQAMEFVDRHVSEKNLIFPKLSSQNMRSFHHATILSPSFHGVRKERLAQWPPIPDSKTTKLPGGGGSSRKIGWGCAARFLKPLPYFRPQSVISPTLFQTWSKIWYPIAELKPWRPGRGKRLRHVHGSWRKR